MKKLLSLVVIIAALFFLDSCKKYDTPEFERDRPAAEKKCHNINAAVALEWYKLQFRFLLERNSTMNGVYFGYLGIGLYESVRNGIHNASSLSSKLYQMPAMPARENKSYHWAESANAAMASLLRSYNTGLTAANLASIDSLENVFNQKFSAEASAATFTRSQAFGRSIATAVYNWSLTSNLNLSNAGYVPPDFPGAWVPTLPALANPVLPYISTARPFMAENLTKVAPPFTAAYSEDPKSYFYQVVKNVYDVSQNLTQEQKDIAMFWVDQGNGVGYTPPGHDFNVITQAIEQRQGNLAIAAEAYAKAGIAEWDATIVCFRSKYTYNLLRPITYIRKLIDPNWLPFIGTPPHPEYPAAHAFVTGAAMAAATRVLGYNLTVTDHTYDFRGWAPRTYTGLFNAAKEAGISRLYGGIHYVPSIKVGLLMGNSLGDNIGKINLRGAGKD